MRSWARRASRSDTIVSVAGIPVCCAIQPLTPAFCTAEIDASSGPKVDCVRRRAASAAETGGGGGGDPPPPPPPPPLPLLLFPLPPPPLPHAASKTIQKTAA